MKLFLLSSSLLAINFLSLVSAKTVVFPVTLTWAKGAPDGFSRDMIFMNGQFPGPELNIDEGDAVEVSCASIQRLIFWLTKIVRCG